MYKIYECNHVSKEVVFVSRVVSLHIISRTKFVSEIYLKTELNCTTRNNKNIIGGFPPANLFPVSTCFIQ